MPHTHVSDIQRGHAKQLRRTMTRAETLLWRHLKADRLAGLNFRRQTPIGNYIADFVAHSCKLIVELDGESHNFEERIRHDERRDCWLESRGYRVLRFTNDDVMKNLEGVTLLIAEAAEQAVPLSPTLPRKEGGSPSAGAGLTGKRGEIMLSPISLVSKAAEFAAHRHTGESRNARPDEPYINHLAEVANILAEATEGADAELVAAGWLHDTVEDELATSAELAAEFSERVAALVAEVTDDMSLPKAQRRQRQIEDAPHKSPGAKLIKIADKISNIRARIHSDSSAADRADLTDYVDWAEQVVAGCRGGNAMLDRMFDDTVKLARSSP